MNQRKDTKFGTGTIVAAVVVVVAIIGGLVYWFAIRDDDKSSTDATSLKDQEFVVEGVPFTFKYPGTFARSTPPQGVLWIAGLAPGDVLDVRRLRNDELKPGALAAEMKKSLRNINGLEIVGQGTDKLGTIPVSTFEVVTRPGGTELRSKLIYFSAAGASWQLECQSRPENRPAIDAACGQMMSTFKLF